MYVLTNSNEGKKLQAGIPMNLQLFADTSTNTNQPTGDHPYNSPDIQAQIAAIMSGNNGNPPQAGDQGTQGQQTAVQQPTEGNQPAAGQQPQGAEGQPSNAPAPQNNPLASVTDPQNGMILGKFKTVDDLVNAYQNLEGFNTQTRQDLSKANQTLEQLQGAIENLKQQNANSQVAASPNANTQNTGNQNTQIDPQAFLDKFYENPIEALKSIMQPTLQSAIDPLMQQFTPIANTVNNIQKQAQWQQDVRDFGTAHPDMAQFKDAMAEILKDPNIADNPKALDIAYGMAKGQKFTDPTSLLKDENYVNQNILNNKDITDKVIQAYLQGLKSGNQTPAVIGSQVIGGSVPLSPGTKPQTFEEAHDVVTRMLSGNQQQ